jgi:hypothetical protein
MLDFFLKHPKSKGETYLQHLRFALSCSFLLFKISLISLVHGLFPNLFQNTTSDAIKVLAQKLIDRNFL